MNGKNHKESAPRILTVTTNWQDLGKIEATNSLSMPNENWAGYSPAPNVSWAGYSPTLGPTGSI